MNKNQMMIFTLAIFILFMALAPIICMATQVTPTFRWSPARPEKVIKKFFEANVANDYHAVKDLMIMSSRRINLPLGNDVSVVGWMDYKSEQYLYIKDVKLINITKLDMYSDPDQKLECYEVTGDFKFKPFAPYSDGPCTFYVYLQQDDIGVWRMYAPESFEFGPKTRWHWEYPADVN